ncbi:hypothetical protein A8709_24325 [Paenibacillus pectinilyticus]|uniref:DUF3397 domain-containing protein n=1 Tax=Paenibacillus pectinilyticus TaxID=512399 RepID=A0A1C1A930_9BACL|nr:DUF3397 domain-containing protein [Paenibacillus pectinilyticus]OCT17114.1 hypothetical protein A8709_24325 [Paenibacillus pectinilyticus]
MDGLVNIISTLYAILAVAPFITFVIIWFLVFLFLKDKKMTTRLTMDVTTLFLLGSVSLMWNKLFQTQFGFWLIILFLLIAFGIIGGYQTHLKGETNLLKVGRLVWRLSFVGLSALYILLFVVHISKNYLFST